jgi:hypothetical protein
MIRTTRTAALLAASGWATLVLMQPALAVDAKAFVDRFAEVYKLGGYDIAFGEARLDGDAIIVDGATVSVEGLDDDAWTIDTEFTFSGVEDTEDGGFYAATLTVPDIDTAFATDPSGTVSVTDIVAEDIRLPAADAINMSALLDSMGSLSTGPLTLTRDGAEIVRYDGFEAINTFDYDDEGALVSVASTFDVAGIWADLTSMGEENPDAAPVIEALGLTEVNGTISQSMSWGLTDGHFVIEKFLFDFDDVGALDFRTDISGLTLPVMDKLNAMQTPAADQTSQAAQAQQMMVGMELLQALTLTSTSIRYDDASLAPKLIDMFAAQSGAERAQFVEGLKSMVPQMVGQLGIPKLTELVVPAVNAFLDDPQSFEVSVRPASPTTLLVLSAAAANPAGLISALGLAVTANEAAQ